MPPAARYSRPARKTQVNTAKAGQSNKRRDGWEISLPGGGALRVYSYPKPEGVPGGAILSVWVFLPENLEGAKGLCKNPCTQEAPLPNEQCGDSEGSVTPRLGPTQPTDSSRPRPRPHPRTCDAPRPRLTRRARPPPMAVDSCLPVFTEDSIFPPGELTRLEALAEMPISTRASKEACGVTTDPNTVCRAPGDCEDITNYAAPFPPPPPEGEEACSGFPTALSDALAAATTRCAIDDGLTPPGGSWSVDCGEVEAWLNGDQPWGSYCETNCLGGSSRGSFLSSGCTSNCEWAERICGPVPASDDGPNVWAGTKLHRKDYCFDSDNNVVDFDDEVACKDGFQAGIPMEFGQPDYGSLEAAYAKAVQLCAAEPRCGQIRYFRGQNYNWPDVAGEPPKDGISGALMGTRDPSGEYFQLFGCEALATGGSCDEALGVDAGSCAINWDESACPRAPPGGTRPMPVCADLSLGDQISNYARKLWLIAGITDALSTAQTTDGAQTLGECQAWCEEQAVKHCALRNGVLSGQTLMCGFVGTASSNPEEGPERRGECHVAVGFPDLITSFPDPTNSCALFPAKLLAPHQTPARLPLAHLAPSLSTSFPHPHPRLPPFSISLPPSPPRPHRALPLHRAPSLDPAR